MEIKIALSDSQFRQLRAAFTTERPIQLLHSVRRAVIDRKPVVLNSIVVNFVGWRPTAEEIESIEQQIRGLVDEVTTAPPRPYNDSFQFLGKVNMKRQRQLVARQAKALRY